MHALAQAAQLPTGFKWAYEKIAEGEPVEGTASEERLRLIAHLHGHPGHAHRYPAGLDFALRGTNSILQEHRSRHLPRQDPGHDENDLSTGEKEKEMASYKELDLKVTVISSDDDPDKVLGELAGSAFMLKASPSGRCLSVIRIERADGQPLGLEAAFEKYWNAHASETPTVKEAVRDAYLAAAKKFGAS